MEDFIFKCDLCDVDVDFFDHGFHVTAIVDGKINPHTHLCDACFEAHIKIIPVLTTSRNTLNRNTETGKA